MWCGAGERAARRCCAALWRQRAERRGAVAERSRSLTMPPDPLLLIRKAKAEKKKAPLALSCASDALPPLELPFDSIVDIM